MRRAEVVALGLVQGPAELLPISSSGHVAALPLLLGWEHADLEGARRKEVEVALHAGGAVGLVIGLRRELMALPLDVALLSMIPTVALAFARRALDRGAARRAGLAGGRPRGRLGGAGAGRPAAGSAAGGGRGAARRRAARARAGVRAGAGGLARGRDAGRGAGARVRAAGRGAALARDRGAGDRGRRGAQGAAAAAAAAGALGAGGRWRSAPRRRRPPRSSRCRSRACSSATARWRRGPPTAARSPPSCSCARIAGDERRLRAFRGGHERGRPRGRGAGRGAEDDRHRPRVALGARLGALRGGARGRAEPGDRGRHRRRRLEADRGRADRPLRHGRDRLRGDERQRRRVRRRGADRAARLPGGRAGRPRGDGGDRRGAQGRRRGGGGGDPRRRGRRAAGADPGSPVAERVRPHRRVLRHRGAGPHGDRRRLRAGRRADRAALLRPALERLLAGAGRRWRRWPSTTGRRRWAGRRWPTRCSSRR